MRTHRKKFLGSLLLLIAPGAAVAQLQGPVILPDTTVLEAFVGKPASVQLSVQNLPSGATVTGWSITTGQLPQGLSLNPSTGLISGTPAIPQIQTFRVRATYQFVVGQTSFVERTYAFNTDIELAFVTASPLAPATAQVPVTRQILASGPVSSFSITHNLPSGVTVSSSQGSPVVTVSGVFPAVASPATYQITVTAFGGTYIGQEKTQQYEIRVYPFPSLSPPPASAQVGQAYSGQLAVTGGVAPFVFDIPSGALPPGLVLNASTGAISGTPEAAGVYSFTARAKDANGAQATVAAQITVQPPALTITTETLPAGRAGDRYETRIAASGGQPPYTFTMASGALPPGLSLRTDGLLEGTPARSGTFSFAIRASDSSTPPQTATRNFTLQITLPPLPQLTITQLGETVQPASQPSFGLQLASAFPVELNGTATLAFTPEGNLPARPGHPLRKRRNQRELHHPGGPDASRAGLRDAVRFPDGHHRGHDHAHHHAAGRRPGVAAGAVRNADVAHSGRGAADHQCRRGADGRRVRGPRHRLFEHPPDQRGDVSASRPRRAPSLATTELSVPVAQAFQNWFSGDASRQYGGQFLLTVSFTVQGSVSSIGNVQVTLTSSAGSGSGSANF
jgi:hypothetical protein